MARRKQDKLERYMRDVLSGVTYLDTDVNFQRCIFLINTIPGVKTISSCQGHPPGTQYKDVKVWMAPYLTVTGDKTAISRLKMVLKPFISKRKGYNGYIGLKRSTTDNWVKVYKALVDLVKDL